MDDEESPVEEFRFQTVGEQLKSERERQSLTLEDLASRTRVPMRHLESIEKSNFSALPGTTYTLGFARSYARALGLAETKVSAELREELAAGGHDSYQAPVPNYEPADPARVPPRALAWIAGTIAVLLIAGYFAWRSFMLDGGTIAPDGTSPAPAVAATEEAGAVETAPAANAPPAADGEVVLTANDLVWVKVYDAQNKRLYEKEMKAGDQYRVPADADKPMIVTGRPQALNVTIAGKAVPPLGSADKTIADVELSAAALLARTPAGATDATATPQPSGAAAAN